MEAEMTVYRIYNQGEVPSLAHGWRSVIALEPGRKWVTVIDWTTLETARLDLATWARMKPEELHDYSPRKIRGAIRRRLEYVQATQAIKDALASLRAA
jgi:hypothetical protein